MMFRALARPVVVLVPALLATGPAVQANPWLRAKTHKVWNTSGRPLLIRLLDLPREGQVRVGWCKGGWFGDQGPVPLTPAGRPDGEQADHLQLLDGEIVQILLDNPEDRSVVEAAFAVELADQGRLFEFRLADDLQSPDAKAQVGAIRQGWEVGKIRALLQVSRTGPGSAAAGAGKDETKSGSPSAPAPQAPGMGLRPGPEGVLNVGAKHPSAGPGPGGAAVASSAQPQTGKKPRRKRKKAVITASGGMGRAAMPAEAPASAAGPGSRLSKAKRRIKDAIAGRKAEEAKRKQHGERRRQAIEAEKQAKREPGGRAVIRLANAFREEVLLLPYTTGAGEAEFQVTLRLFHPDGSHEGWEYGSRLPGYSALTLHPGGWMELEIQCDQPICARPRFRVRTRAEGAAIADWDGFLYLWADLRILAEQPEHQRLHAGFDPAAADLEDRVELHRSGDKADRFSATYQLRPQTRDRQQRAADLEARPEA